VKILSEGAELLTNGRKDGQTDRQTDMMKLIAFFRNLANAPKTTIREHSTLVILDEEGLLYTFLT